MEPDPPRRRGRPERSAGRPVLGAGRGADVAGVVPARRARPVRRGRAHLLGPAQLLRLDDLVRQAAVPLPRLGGAADVGPAAVAVRDHQGHRPAAVRLPGPLPVLRPDVRRRGLLPDGRPGRVPGPEAAGAGHVRQPTDGAGADVGADAVDAVLPARRDGHGPHRGPDAVPGRPRRHAAVRVVVQERDGRQDPGHLRAGHVQHPHRGPPPRRPDGPAVRQRVLHRLRPQQAPGRGGRVPAVPDQPDRGRAVLPRHRRAGRHPGRERRRPVAGPVRPGRPDPRQPGHLRRGPRRDLPGHGPDVRRRAAGHAHRPGDARRRGRHARGRRPGSAVGGDPPQRPAGPPRRQADRVAAAALRRAGVRRLGHAPPPAGRGRGPEHADARVVRLARGGVRRPGRGAVRRVRTAAGPEELRLERATVGRADRRPLRRPPPLPPPAVRDRRVLDRAGQQPVHHGRDPAVHGPAVAVPGRVREPRRAGREPVPRRVPGPQRHGRRGRHAPVDEPVRPPGRHRQRRPGRHRPGVLGRRPVRRRPLVRRLRRLRLAQPGPPVHGPGADERLDRVRVQLRPLPGRHGGRPDRAVRGGRPGRGLALAAVPRRHAAADLGGADRVGRVPRHRRHEGVRDDLAHDQPGPDPRPST